MSRPEPDGHRVPGAECCLFAVLLDCVAQCATMGLVGVRVGKGATPSPNSKPASVIGNYRKLELACH